VGSRFLLDQGLPRDAAGLLRESGHECLHVAEIGMGTALDRDILSRAIELDSIVVTLDADFHAIVALSGAKRPSIIRLRMEGLRAPAITSFVISALNKFQTELESGAFVTIKRHKITCHRLPIGGSSKP
jgi:predicted nuclease of predicted toxin-antitoxin system